MTSKKLLAIILAIQPLSAFSSGADWDQPYLGFSLGRVLGDASNAEVNGTMYNSRNIGEFSTNGGIVGFKAGKNWIINQSNWLVGTELEIGRLLIDGSKQLPEYVGVRSTTDSVASAKNGSFFHISEKFGRMLTNDLLVFAKVGYIQTDIRQEYRDDDPVGCVITAGTKTEARGGYTVGFGTEYMFKNNISARLDYTHYGFGSAINHATACGLNNSQYNYDFKHTLDLDALQIGVSYYF